MALQQFNGVSVLATVIFALASDSPALTQKDGQRLAAKSSAFGGGSESSQKQICPNNIAATRCALPRS